MNARDIANDQHRRFYVDDAGCRAGHIPARRYTSTGNCVACHKLRYRNGPKSNEVTVVIPVGLEAAFDAMCKSLGITLYYRSTRGDTTLTPVDLQAQAAQRAEQEALQAAEIARRHAERIGQRGEQIEVAARAAYAGKLGEFK